ncbi:FAD-dependent oxidoreductase [Aurantimonas endophytica]|uniref:Thioredoxin reductase n=1 Tax=Aurantimonas endophytica TaxID=1522175 RepID=A0A7W6HDJ9_9HYPH|nr:FAD-dependent oxidoreductase [Aurantimonas endophytica]MBB4003097.1 thioredoxin reductase (NADPH) [Aurantimonas endophytica]MCO6403969.1 FAD-dependent oxidoreductase [Aurantimonas endophytica]
MSPVETVDPTDPWLRESQTFPHLPEEMIERVEGYGRVESIGEDTMLFTRGQRNIDFFLVLSGMIEIVAEHAGSDGRVLYTYRHGQFTGEQNLFNNRTILLSGRAKAGTEVVRVANADFRRLITGEPDIGEIIMRAYILRRVGFIRHAEGGVMLIGARQSSGLLRIQRFLIRNAYPNTVLDREEDAATLMAELHLSPEDLPAVITPDKTVLRNPSKTELADQLGLSEPLDPAHVYDVAVVGAGPAGLAAAVYGASEGLETVVLEGVAPGGQAGTSSKIENYLGFPTGISGEALAGRAQIQAQKFGARLAISRDVAGLDCCTDPYRLTLEDGQTLQARAVVVATGARYGKLDLERYAEFEGQGIQYAATAMEAQLCSNEEVIVVGGGNSAGQAAMFLSRTCRHVHMLVRSRLSATMSDYLIRRIEGSAKITVHTQSELTGLDGDTSLEAATFVDKRTGETTRIAVRSIFVMIGAAPNTEWLNGCLALDDKGFVATGTDDGGSPLASPFATSQTGIYAVGDVRSGSVKRVASAVGEGSVVIQAIHRFLHPEP